MTTGTDDRSGENDQRPESPGSEGFRLPSSGLTGILGGSLEEQLARAQERLAFYESFDRLIQENITRSGELMREAIDLREQARFEIEHGRVESERQMVAERERQREVLASLFDQVDDVRQATDRLADRVANALADLAEPDSVGVNQAPAPAAITTGESSRGELEHANLVNADSVEPTPFQPEEATPPLNIDEDADDEPAKTGTGNLPDPFAAYAASPSGEFAVLETNLEDVVRQHADLALEEDPEIVPFEPPPNISLDEPAFFGDEATSGPEEPAVSAEPEAPEGHAPRTDDDHALAAYVSDASPEPEPPAPSQLAEADIQPADTPESIPSLRPTEEPGPSAASEQVAPATKQPLADGAAGDAPADSPAEWPRPIMVLVHGVPRAAAALSLQRHLAGLGHVEGVEAREYAEGVLRLQVTVSRALSVEDLRAWDGGRGLEPVHVQEHVIEVKLPGAAGF